MKVLRIIITVLGMILCTGIGAALVFVEARMLIAGDYLAYGDPTCGFGVTLSRLIYYAAFTIVLPVLGLILRKRSVRIILSVFVIVGMSLVNFRNLPGDLYSLLIFIAPIAGSILYLVGGLLSPSDEY